jgi:hypothetical protein
VSPQHGSRYSMVGRAQSSLHNIFSFLFSSSAAHL